MCLTRDAACFAFDPVRPGLRIRPCGRHGTTAPASHARTHLNEPSHCLSCGACCATYRVSFYWAEALGPLEPWTERLTPHLACMVGTSRVLPRCAALQGPVGNSAFCLVYASRPSPCRELEPGDERCDRARTRHGLDPVSRPIQVQWAPPQAHASSPVRQSEALPEDIAPRAALDMNS